MAHYKKLESPAIAYEVNPSTQHVESGLIVKRTKRTIKGDKSLIITDARTGEQQSGYYGATFYEEKEVDPDQFIKLYVGGMDELMGLSPSGLKVFKLIYAMLMERPNIDVLALDCKALILLKIWKWSQPTFNNGLNELLSKQIIFKSVYISQYFINIKFLFNGDRINVVKSYRLKQADTCSTNKAFWIDDTI